jgi:stage V sporulation protein B
LHHGAVKSHNPLCLGKILVQSSGDVCKLLHFLFLPDKGFDDPHAVKIFLNYTLIAMPNINIYGASIASITCYTISMLPNLFFVHKYTGLKVQIVDIFLKPALASALMGLLLYGLSRWLPEGRLWTILIVLIGIISYAVFALLTGALKKSDLAPFLRKGKKQEA